MAAPTNAANVKKALANTEPSTHVALFRLQDKVPIPSASDPLRTPRMIVLNAKHGTKNSYVMRVVDSPSTLS